MNEEQNIRPMGKFARSRELAKSAWQVLKLDKELTALPLIGLAASLVAIIVGGILAIIFSSFTGHKLASNHVTGYQAHWHLNWPVVIVIGLILITLAFISNFIATAISRGALDRFEGHDPTVKSSLTAARQRAGSIFKYSLLALTVGLILNFIQERVPFAGKIFTWLGRLVWGVATFFVIPIIAMSDKPVGPIDATKQSVNTIKKVWGESLVVNIGIGLIALLSILVYLPITVAISLLAGNLYLPLGIVLGIVALLGLFGLILIFSVLSAIVQTAIYYWAVTGRTPETFNKELLRTALTPKKARKIFA